MNREIKFRVWNGIEMVTDITVGKFGTFYVNPENNGLSINDYASITPFTTKYNDNIPLMQYTGLKDKNGKEIYEGDILCITNVDLDDGTETKRFGAVEWDVNRCLFYITNQEWKMIPPNSNWTIVGSIYENPKLLK